MPLAFTWRGSKSLLLPLALPWPGWKGLYAHYALYIQYSDFGADKAMSIMTYAVFGGIDFWFGGALGAAILSYMPVLLQVFEQWRLEVHGAIILSVMAMRPQGVLARGFVADVRNLWQRLKTVWSSPERRGATHWRSTGWLVYGCRDGCGCEHRGA